MARIGTALLLACALFAPFVVHAQATGDDLARMDKEVTALLDALRTSGCDFNRNGSWYEGDEAAKHLQRKYDYVRSKVAHTEEFIEQAGSKSSMSGKAYEVRCGETAPVPSGEWLVAKIEELRASGSLDEK